MSKAEELMKSVSVHHRAGQEIYVEFLNRGFRVRLGCVTMALVDQAELFEWLQAYIEDPESFHSEYLRRQAKAASNGPPPWSNQFIPPPRPTATGIMGGAGLMGGSFGATEGGGTYNPQPEPPQEDGGDTVGHDEEPRNR